MKPEYETALEPLIGANEAAKYLGFSALTIRRMAHEGRLPAYAFPKGKDKEGNDKFLFRYRMSDLKAYLDSLRRKPVQCVQHEEEIPLQQAS